MIRARSTDLLRGLSPQDATQVSLLGGPTPRPHKHADAARETIGPTIDVLLEHARTLRVARPQRSREERMRNRAVLRLPMGALQQQIIHMLSHAKTMTIHGQAWLHMFDAC